MSENEPDLDWNRGLEGHMRKWMGCTRCALGPARDADEKRISPQVFGAGPRRSIMVVGNSPSWKEEKEARHVAGDAGELLRNAFVRLGLTDVYYTGSTLCRSAQPVTEADGVTQKTVERGNRAIPIYEDVPPKHAETLACRVRLLEEIYTVDPYLIVTLGADATKAVTGAHCNIVQQRGEPQILEFEGVSVKARIGKNSWVRKYQGSWLYPVDRATVKYMVIPTYHPQFVLEKKGDRGGASPATLFFQDLQHIAEMVKLHRDEIRGEVQDHG